MSWVCGLKVTEMGPKIMFFNFHEKWTLKIYCFFAWSWSYNNKKCYMIFLVKSLVLRFFWSEGLKMSWKSGLSSFMNIAGETVFDFVCIVVARLKMILNDIFRKNSCLKNFVPKIFIKGTEMKSLTCINLH